MDEYLDDFEGEEDLCLDMDGGGGAAGFWADLL